MLLASASECPLQLGQSTSSTYNDFSSSSNNAARALASLSSSHLNATAHLTDEKLDYRASSNRPSGMCIVYMLTGQFADKPTRGQSSHGLVNSPTANFFKLRKDYNIAVH